MNGIDRRTFSAALTAGLSGAWPARSGATSGSGAFTPAGPAGGLTDVAGLRVGHFTDPRRPTGCTVVLAEAGAVAGVDVRGGAPGTRETDLLDPVNSVQQVHAVVLSGGSAFGLEAATGVVRYLEEKGVGFPVSVGKVPIVPAAILYDLGVGDWTIRPDARAGYEAARAAAAGPVAEGSVGAGTGATVGKLFGATSAMKGGIGTASVRLPGGAVVSALVAVNALGDVMDPATGRVLAGMRTRDGKDLGGTVDALLAGETPGRPLAGQNSTIGVVATNVALTKAEATKVARMAHDGLARAIRPVHTPWDGDTLFALSAGTLTVEQAPLVVGALAAEVVARAVVRAVTTATGLPGYPAAADLGRV
ncbi:MAG TPA: P1 family peptidase [Vicinamibacteria bacterium]|nr:P1 family peptidase [Vicinamibacteria bacterium]